MRGKTAKRLRRLARGLVTFAIQNGKKPGTVQQEYKKMKKAYKYSKGQL